MVFLCIIIIPLYSTGSRLYNLLLAAREAIFDAKSGVKVDENLSDAPGNINSKSKFTYSAHLIILEKRKKKFNRKSYQIVYVEKTWKLNRNLNRFSCFYHRLANVKSFVVANSNFVDVFYIVGRLQPIYIINCSAIIHRYLVLIYLFQIALSIYLFHEGVLSAFFSCKSFQLCSKEPLAVFWIEHSCLKYKKN